MKTIFDIFPLIHDVFEYYDELRSDGIDKCNAVREILDCYADELADMDDAPQVWVGLSIAMYEADELTKTVINHAEKSFPYLISVVTEEYKESFADAKTRICDMPHSGKIRTYSKPRSRKKYIPEWEVGDTFYCKMLGSYPASFGIDNWNIIIRKVGTEEGDDSCQVVCLTLSEPNTIPRTTQDLDALGLLPSFEYDDGFNYLFKIQIPSAEQLSKIKFVPIGNFHGATLPYTDWKKESQRALFMSSSVEAGIPDWIIHSCLNRKMYGIIHLPK